eukprot:m.311612 g.311612  ORF g.311612 m.311612 type:complete len:83 (-) comp20228_c0_seq2:782-1030(-)
MRHPNTASHSTSHGVRHSASHRSPTQCHTLHVSVKECLATLAWWVSRTPCDAHNEAQQDALCTCKGGHKTRNSAAETTWRAT